MSAANMCVTHFLRMGAPASSAFRSCLPAVAEDPDSTSARLTESCLHALNGQINQTERVSTRRGQIAAPCKGGAQNFCSIAVPQIVIFSS